jgi:hypothetical protein
MAAHARGAAWYALKVVALTHPDTAVSAVGVEDEWQRRCLPARFFDFVYHPGERDSLTCPSGGWLASPTRAAAFPTTPAFAAGELSGLMTSFVVSHSNAHVLPAFVS